MYKQYEHFNMTVVTWLNLLDLDYLVVWAKLEA